MVAKKFTACIVGVGRIGFSLQKDKKREQPASHSLALFKNKFVKIVAGCDIDENKLKNWKKIYKNANTYTNIHKMLEKESPDIVVIAVNEKNHLSIALEVIKNKPKLVILEKPVAPNPEQARLILRYSKKYKVPVSINHERRFSLDYLIVKNIIEKKQIGEIQSVFASFSSSATVYKVGSENIGDCSLIHDGTHLIDIINFLFNIKCANPKIDNMILNSKKDVESLNFHFKEKILDNNQKTMFYFEIAGNKKYFGFDIEIRGNKGKILIGNGYLKVYERKESPFYTGFYSLMRNKTIKRPKKTKYFSNMIENCINFLCKKEKLSSTIKSGIKTLNIIYRIIDKIKKIPHNSY